jgi:hydrogenase/urease accessory protein HupE
MRSLRHMSKRSHMPSGRAVAAAAVLLALTPSPAAAHALFGDYDPDRPVIEYLTLGFGHMVGGWDHLLFIAGVVLLAGSVRSAAKLISLFVAGHSLTLLVATLAGWRLDATAVDVVIALSLVYVGVQGIRGRPENFRLFGTVVFLFGLAHGLGLSTRLQDLGLPDGGLVGRVLLFNVGVELGQLVALGVIVGVAALLLRGLRDRADLRRYAFAALALAGLVAATLISFPDTGSDEKSEQAATPAATAEAGECRTEDSAPPQFIGGDHPDKFFFAPGEEAPEEDLVHVIGDGLVIVRYDPDLPEQDVQAIEQVVSDPASRQYVIAAPDAEQSDAVKAIAATRTLTCGDLDQDALVSFRDEWFTFLQQQAAP